MKKKVIAFDLDGTLAVSKSPITPKIATLLDLLLKKYHVCIISGGMFYQFDSQVLSNLDITSTQKKKLHLMPTCGTRYYKYDSKTDDWIIAYSNDLSEKDRLKIKKALLSSLNELGLKEPVIYGDLVEDRNSQITLSTLGQRAPAEVKAAWDPDKSKKIAIAKLAAKKLPKFEVRVGGLTSIDVTSPGIDKAYGMNKLIEELSIETKDILFIGDDLGENGNDYPVKAMGIDCVEVENWQQTAQEIEIILAL